MLFINIIGEDIAWVQNITNAKSSALVDLTFVWTENTYLFFVLEDQLCATEDIFFFCKYLLSIVLEDQLCATVDFFFFFSFVFVEHNRSLLSREVIGLV